MERVKIIHIPSSKMVSSGRFILGDEVFKRFSEKILNKQVDLFPQDFMWFDPKSGKMVWYYSLINKSIDTESFETIDFDGGLYASAVSKDEDDVDGELVYKTIKEWVDQSGYFELDERDEHQTMFSMPLPKAKEIMGYAQLEIFVPIKVRKTNT